MDLQQDHGFSLDSRPTAPGLRCALLKAPYHPPPGHTHAAWLATCTHTQMNNIPQSVAQACKGTTPSAMHQPPPPELEQPSPEPQWPYPCDQAEEEPPPPTRQRKTSKILIESLGRDCQVKPEEKNLLGARAEEMEAEESKAACVSPAPEEVKIQKKPDAKGTETTSTQVSAPMYHQFLRPALNYSLRLSTDHLHPILL